MRNSVVGIGIYIAGHRKHIHFPVVDERACRSFNCPRDHKLAVKVAKGKRKKQAPIATSQDGSERETVLRICIRSIGDQISIIDISVYDVTEENVELAVLPVCVAMIGVRTKIHSLDSP